MCLQYKSFENTVGEGEIAWKPFFQLVQIETICKQQNKWDWKIEILFWKS